MTDFETAYDKNSDYWNQPFFISGTNEEVAVKIDRINDWHVTYKGFRDEKLTSLMLSVIGNRTFYHDGVVSEVANALRRQWKLDQPVVLNYKASISDLYNMVWLSPSPLGKVIAAELACVDARKRFKITLEEIK